MIKLERHRLLQEGSIVASRVGLWKSSDKVLRKLSHKTAAIMGYHD
jgi:hypothetical protein